MGQRGRPKQPVVLEAPDREVLERWARRPSAAQALAMRARIVLAAADGDTNRAVARNVGVNENTVAKWRRRCLERGVQGLLDEPRPGAPRTITDERVER